jgi:hypothetical protein
VPQFGQKLIILLIKKGGGVAPKFQYILSYTILKIFKLCLYILQLINHSANNKMPASPAWRPSSIDNRDSLENLTVALGKKDHCSLRRKRR